MELQNLINFCIAKSSSKSNKEFTPNIDLVEGVRERKKERTINTQGRDDNM